MSDVEFWQVGGGESDKLSGQVVRDILDPHNVLNLATVAILFQE